MTNIIFLGPPGVGKGTQAQNLAKKLNMAYFGTGDLMREETKKGSELGKKFEEIWNRGQGELIPEESVNTLVTQKIAEFGLDKNYIFDGYPRTISQAQRLEQIFANSPKKFLVVNIDSPAEILAKRMSTRRICAKCSKVFFQPEMLGIKKCIDCQSNLIQRNEDKADILYKRIEVYNQQTKPLIDYYQEKGILINIDGTPPIQIVEQLIWAQIKDKINAN